MVLTPDGESVLVVEQGANRIRIIKDANGDGVADSLDSIFATEENGLVCACGYVPASEPPYPRAWPDVSVCVCWVGT